MLPALGHVPHKSAPVLAYCDNARPVWAEIEIIDLLLVCFNLVCTSQLGECPQAEVAVIAASREQLIGGGAKSNTLLIRLRCAANDPSLNTVTHMFIFTSGEAAWSTSEV